MLDIYYILRSKKKVDFLIVSVTADQFAEKAPGKPLFKLDSGINFKSLKLIDYVIESIHHQQLKLSMRLSQTYILKVRIIKIIKIYQVI